MANQNLDDETFRAMQAAVSTLSVGLARLFSRRQDQGEGGGPAALDAAAVPDELPREVSYMDGPGANPLHMPPAIEEESLRIDRVLQVTSTMGVHTTRPHAMALEVLTRRVKYHVPPPFTPRELQEHAAGTRHSHVVPVTRDHLFEYFDRWVHFLWHGVPTANIGPAVGKATSITVGQAVSAFRVSLHVLLQRHSFVQVHHWVSFVWGFWRRTHLLIVDVTPEVWGLVQGQYAADHLLGGEVDPQ